jgi:hypothetical protein
MGKTVSTLNQTDCDRWRELALHHLPQLREIIDSASSHVDLWWSFKELVSQAGASEPRSADLESICNYAWWCITQSGDEQFVSDVEAYFYEDFPVYSNLERLVSIYIAPSQFERLESCFRFRLEEHEFTAFRHRYYQDRERMKKTTEAADQPLHADKTEVPKAGN